MEDHFDRGEREVSDYLAIRGRLEDGRAALGGFGEPVWSQALFALDNMQSTIQSLTEERDLLKRREQATRDLLEMGTDETLARLVTVTEELDRVRELAMPCCGDVLGQHTGNGYPVECECGCRCLIEPTSLIEALRKIQTVAHPSELAYEIARLELEPERESWEVEQEKRYEQFMGDKYA